MRLNEIVPGYVLTLDDFLSQAECLSLVAEAEHLGFGPAPQERRGQRGRPGRFRPQRVEQQRPGLAAVLWKSLRPYVERDAPGGWQPVGLSQRMRFCRYEPGQRFDAHTDVPSVHGLALSRMSLLVYLNDDFHGGATRFRRLRVQPRRGTALIFRHELEHEEARLLLGRKYVLRSDVLYRRAELMRDARSTAPSLRLPGEAWTTGRSA